MEIFYGIIISPFISAKKEDFVVAWKIRKELQLYLLLSFSYSDNLICSLIDSISLNAKDETVTYNTRTFKLFPR